MNLSFEDLILKINEYDTPVFLCDENLNIIKTNKFIQDNDISIKPDENISALLYNAVDFYALKEDVLKNIPFFSTKFDFFGQKAVLTANLYTCKDKENYILIFITFSSNLSNFSLDNSNIAFISENLKNPISNISNISDNLARRLDNNEDYIGLKYLNELIKNCHKILSVSSSIERYYSLINNNVTLKTEYIDLKSFIENICMSLKLLLQKSGFKVITYLPEFPVIVSADFNLLSLCILNILTNSCSFSPKNSVITVSLTTDNGKAIISIKDQGYGMSASVLKRVFEPFFTIKSTPSIDNEAHLGLGLPITKKIVELHSGNIVISSSENSHTTVTITLPIIDLDNIKTDMQVKSYKVKYSTNKLSDMYVLFSNICDINFY